MREALAAADHDYILTEAPRARQRPRRATPRQGKRRRFVPTPLQARRALRFVALGLFVAALAGIALNALTLQKTRHPAPLFGHPAAALAARSSAEPEPAPPPAAPPQKPPEAAPAHGYEPGKSGGDEKSASVRPYAEAAPPPRDAISQLLGKSPDAEPPPAVAAKTVLAVQKALVKRGFVLKADGVMGATTRQAIERYERDHGRSSHGELTPALMRRLAAEAGAANN